MVKRLLYLVFFLVILCVSLGCKKKDPEILSDIDEFEILFSDALKYDIRDIDDCEKGHIPSFLCMGGVTSDEKLVDTILLTTKSKDKKIIIISYENDFDRINNIFSLLQKEKYYNLYSFEGGYENYVKLKGDSFVPEEGCDC